MFGIGCTVPSVGVSSRQVKRSGPQELIGATVPIRRGDLGVGGGRRLVRSQAPAG
jgi:hypothetical protein